MAVVAASLEAGCAPPSESVSEPQSEPWFVERAGAAGIAFRHVSGHREQHLMPEIMSGGVALADFDGDGRLDIYLVQGGHRFTGGDGERAGNHLYVNRGDGTFGEEAQARGADDDGYGMGAAAADYDNDGDVDIYITNVGPNVLLRNDGTGFFDNVAAGAGVDEPGWGTAAAFVDLDADDDLDLFVANYITWSAAADPECYSGGVLTYCAPEDFQSPAPDHLFRNDGDGTFTDVSEAVGLNLTFGNGLGVVAADFDGDGRSDLFVANDMTSNQLWLNRGDMQFQDAAMDRGVAVDGHGNVKAGMGVAARDVDADGDPDILVVNLKAQSDSLFRNEGTHFEDATTELGLGTVSRRFTRFGIALVDLDNDGRLDLYEANGRIAPDDADGGDPFAEPNLLLEGHEGGFRTVRPIGGTDPALVHTSRGVAVGDLDDDGGLDLVVVNRDAAAYVLTNSVRDRGNWIRFRVLTGNRDAIGATVSATVGGRRVTGAVQPEGSYLASSDPRVHFGLGSESSVGDVAVRWVGGAVERFGDFDAGREVVLVEGRGKSD